MDDRHAGVDQRSRSRPPRPRPHTTSRSRHRRGEQAGRPRAAYRPHAGPHEGGRPLRAPRAASSGQSRARPPAWTCRMSGRVARANRRHAEACSEVVAPPDGTTSTRTPLEPEKGRRAARHRRGTMPIIAYRSPSPCSASAVDDPGLGGGSVRWPSRVYGGSPECGSRQRAGGDARRRSAPSSNARRSLARRPEPPSALHRPRAGASPPPPRPADRRLR